MADVFFVMPEAHPFSLNDHRDFAGDSIAMRSASANTHYSGVSRFLLAVAGISLLAAFFLPLASPSNKSAFAVLLGIPRDLSGPFSPYPFATATLHSSIFGGNFAIGFLLLGFAFWPDTSSKKCNDVLRYCVCTFILFRWGGVTLANVIGWRIVRTDFDVYPADVGYGAWVPVLLLAVAVVHYVRRPQSARGLMVLATGLLAAWWIYIQIVVLSYNATLLAGAYMAGIATLIAFFVLLYESWRSHGEFLGIVKHDIFGQPVPIDLSKCQNCEYSLIGLTENRCPECGESFDHEITPPA